MDFADFKKKKSGRLHHEASQISATQSSSPPTAPTTYL
jgi:hypothetical protein